MIRPKRLTDVVNKEILWLWKPYIAYGKVTLLQGSTGVGKTTLLVKLIADLSRGMLPPTMYKGKLQKPVVGEPVRTYYVSIENKINDTFSPLFDMFGGNREYVDYQSDDDEEEENEEEQFVLGRKDIESCAIEIGAKLIVVDPWQQFLDRKSKADNDALRAMICSVQKVAERTGVAVVLAGNFTKSGGDDLLKGFGGAELMNTLRCILTIRDDPDGDKSLKLLEPTKMSLLGKEMVPVGIRQDEDSHISFEDYEYTEGESIRPVDFLRNLLSDRSLDRNEVEALANNAGFSMSQMYRCRVAAGVEIIRNGNRTTIWRLKV